VAEHAEESEERKRAVCAARLISEAINVFINNKETNVELQC